MKKLLLILFVAFGLSFGVIENVNAQCPMCRSAIESNQTSGGSVGKSINKGILYLMAMPYLLAGSIGVIYLLKRKKIKNN